MAGVPEKAIVGIDEDGRAVYELAMEVTIRIVDV